ncbi:peptide-binding protein [Leptospira sp. mixed culture ATI2-C-A1]|nr:peptide-binding protein [Leptospira sp. mixed culture ATI2-C-A1]
MIQRIYQLIIFFSLTMCSYGKDVYISGNKVVLREKPSEKSKVILQLNRNTKVTVLEEITNENSDYRLWTKVRLLNHSEGYVYSDYIFLNPESFSPGKNTIPKLGFDLNDGNLQIFDKKTSKLLDTIPVDSYFQKVYKTEQKGHFLLIILKNNEEEYEGIVYDLNLRRVLLKNLSKQIHMHMCYFESVSPQNLFLVFDVGTGFVRTKYVFDLAKSEFHVFDDMRISLQWIAPKTFIFYVTPKEGETNLPILKGDTILEEKRIWRNGNIYRTNTTRYTYQD